MSDFVHLHLHTEFSLLDGACRIDELFDQAARLGMPALSVTEHGNMFSAISFYDAARKRGVKPILGCEVYVAPGDRRSRSGTPGETANHLVLLAENNEGFHNLVKLVSAGYTEGFYYKPRIDKALLAEHARGLIGLSSCLKGEVATGLRTEQESRAREAAAQYRDILGPGNFFLEMQYQGIDEQRVVNAGIPAIARDLGLGMVCMNDVHYLRRDDHKPHDILLCIGTGRTVNDAERMRYYGDQSYLKTPEEMSAVFGHVPEAMRNTVATPELPLPDPDHGVPQMLPHAILNEDPYPIKALIVNSFDPLMSIPDTNLTKKALEKLDLIVTIDINFSDMAWYSDVILPESVFLERTDCVQQANGLKPQMFLRSQATPPRYNDAIRSHHFEAACRSVRDRRLLSLCQHGGIGAMAAGRDRFPTGRFCR